MSCERNQIKDLCMKYPYYQQLKQSLEDKMKQDDHKDDIMQAKYQYVMTQINKIDRILQYMELAHGKSARGMFYMYFVEGKQQKDIASYYHMSLRTLQRRFQMYKKMIEDVIS